MEKSNRIERSEAWNNIYEVLARLDLKESTGDTLDRPSAATEIEELFLKLLPIQNVSNFNFEDFAKAILRYDYNELISGKVAVCEKDSNSTIVCYDTKEECYNWVLQNYCC